MGPTAAKPRSQVRLIATEFVKPFVKNNRPMLQMRKHPVGDPAPGMCLVPVKDEQKQTILVLRVICDVLLKARTAQL